jgi:2-keto-3-deoxy-L-rhamnonate aldolase RhmA
MLKKRLLSNELTIGSWISLGHPAIAEIMASAGFDWLVIDLEHSVIDLRVAEELIRTIDLKGCSPLVRLTSNDRNQIKRVMDAGAHGVVVPMVNSAGEARQAVAAVKYPPEGVRGVGLARAQGYGAAFQRYKEWVATESIVVVQIEHIDAVRAIDEILEVTGVDAFIVGPYDLTGSMGIPGEFGEPQFEQAMQKILEAGRKHQIPGGIHIVEPDLPQLKQRIDEGYRFLAYSVDIRMLDVLSRQAVNKVRGGS